MSLITACPACQTQFEVNDEQLQAYAGKVRCGECNHVFDARASLLGSSSAPVLPTAPLAEPEQREQPLPPAEVTHAHDSDSDTAPEAVAIPDVLLDSPADISQLAWEPQTDAEDEKAIPEFLRNISLADDRQVTPEKTRSGWGFAVLSALLALSLLMQTVYFARTSLAASYPQSKPLLQSMCLLAHCEVPLPQDISQLTIDDADIQEHREREGVLVFNSVLINHGTVLQAYPMIELTLTGVTDEPVLRKILKPAEYLPAAVQAGQGLAAQQEQAVKAIIGVEDKTITGFRVAIAY